jgi:Niemann-Pick C1 protein
VKSAAIEGVKILQDIRAICENAPYGKFFSFTQRYYDFESYVVFNKELTSNVALALLAVFVVILTVTANITETMMVLFCVALVDLFLFSLLAMWDVKLNSVTVVNIVIAIGLAVDYSAHIGHSYLMVEPPEFHRDQGNLGRPLSNFEKRVYKARGALGKMGSSVFHGALSTFLAIIVLSPSDSYIFKSFFKMWFGIIIYGVANGFILLPVMLSLCGPITGAKHRAVADEGQQSRKSEIEFKDFAKVNIGDLEVDKDESSDVSSDTGEDPDDGGQGGETEAQRRRREKAASRAALR